ncbi:hypothetical protein Skr01_29340 [Sphaerisporangium krabiense]|nr:hypothetical protein Skr01_29340 [Sphaerisporangium krabiense]
MTPARLIKLGFARSGGLWFVSKRAGIGRSLGATLITRSGMNEAETPWWNSAESWANPVVTWPIRVS